MSNWKVSSKERPEWGRFIFVWDSKNQKKMLIQYFSGHETWLHANHEFFPLWKYATAGEELKSRYE